ncbi:MAG TPA: carboxypeptidase-like regulatory domain-containing protein [Bacteroidia bacterium]|nr:carboxypeptidase-like regulatory domain-containing protein [Bacteroidia bacterium]
MRKGFFHCLTACAALLCLLPFSSAAQQTIPTDTTRKIIQFSGIVLDADSLNGIPYVAIVVRHSERGVYSNLNGYYSMVVQAKDTIDFYALGYKRASFILPDTITSDNYNHVQALKLDTILLHEAVVYPWPSKDQFKNAFLTANVPSDDLDRARKNLAQAEMVQLAQNVAMDGGMVYQGQMQQRVNQNYYAGQKPPNNLLNPVAWSRFIQALNNGELKRQ